MGNGEWSKNKCDLKQIKNILLERAFFVGRVF
jgi:hypothetical protein